MSVYVDSAKNKLGRMKMSHMLADSLEELHEMADRIGLKREWFQDHGTPHYDVSQAKRALAVRNGAIEANKSKVVELIKYWRTKYMSQVDKESAEALAIFFDEAEEIRPAHLLYEDLKSIRPDITKFDFYLIANGARRGHDGKAPNGDLGWSLKLKEEYL